MTTNKKGGGCTRLLGRSVFLLWVFLLGGLGGIWFGFNLARMYPEVSIPQSVQLSRLTTLSIPVIRDPFYAVTTRNGVLVQVTDIKRLGEVVEVSFTTQNNAKEKTCVSGQEFSLRDSQDRIFDSGWGFDYAWCDNPGFSGTMKLECRVPPNAKGVKLYYIGNGEPAFMASVPN